MDRRAELNQIFKDILGSDYVYFQPPEGLRMNYPAIVYSRSNINNDFGDDLPYKQDIAYQVTVIDADPDSEIVAAVSKLPLCRFNRHFTSDDLNHDVFTIYY